MEQGIAILIINSSQTYNKVSPKVYVTSGQAISQALTSLGIKFRQPVIALVNGETSDLTRVLEPGDEVRFFPQIAGG